MIWLRMLADGAVAVDGGGSGLGAWLLRTTLALIGVSLLAVLVLWRLRQRLPGRLGPLRVVARLALEPRRSLYLVEAAGRFLLVGAGEGALSLLAELEAAEVRPLLEASRAAPDDGFGALLRRVIGRSAVS